MENDKALVKKIRADLYERTPDKKRPPYIPLYIYCMGYLRLTQEDACKSIGKTATTVQKYIDSDVLDVLEDIKLERLRELGDRIQGLTTYAVDKLEQLVQESDRDSTSLKAAEMILKQYNLISNIAKVEHSGKLEIPGLVVQPFESEED